MRATTAKMLRYYSNGAGTHYDQMKVWWNKLSAPERVQAAKEMREVNRKRKAEEEEAARKRMIAGKR